MRRLKVFVVDDDPDFAEGVAITLEIEGHEVTLARSGREAVETLQDQDFDITLMDVRMPGMNGIESLLKIREIKPDAKVIMMTAYTVEELMNQAFDEGALGVLHKPVDSEILLKTLLDATRSGVVLVADDDPDFSEGMETSLSKAGYTVTLARTGRQALDLALNNEIDILLLDMRLPDLNGLEVFELLRKRGCELPTIIVTGYDIEESDSIKRAIELSAKGCLVKPVGYSDLLQAIDAVI